MSKKSEKTVIHVRTRGPVQGAGTEEVDLKASPAGTVSTAKVVLNAQPNGHSPSEIFF